MLAKLSRGPVEHAPTQQVHVQMVNSLPGPRPIVDNRPVASRLKLPFPGQLGSYGEETTDHGAIGAVRFLQRRQVLSRYHQQMYWRLRADVLNGERLVVLINNSGRLLSFDDFAKDTIVHLPLPMNALFGSVDPYHIGFRRKFFPNQLAGQCLRLLAGAFLPHKDKIENTAAVAFRPDDDGMEFLLDAAFQSFRIAAIDKRADLD